MKLKQLLRSSGCVLGLVLLFDASAQAERMPITLSMSAISDLRPNSNRQFEAVAPNTLTLFVITEPFSNGDVPIVTFANIQPDSQERMLGYKHGDPPSYSWTITADNAADFGLNWLEFQNRLNETEPGQARTSIEFVHPSPPDSNPRVFAFDSIRNALFDAGLQDAWATEFQLHEVKISIAYYFWHDVLEGLRGVEIEAEVRGNANVRVIPEPAAFSMLTIGLMLAGVMVTTRRRLQPSPPRA